MEEIDWSTKLKEQYPQFKIYGDPKQHFEKISRNKGDAFYIYENELVKGKYNLHRNKSKESSVNWKVVILGNNPPIGSKFVVALFKSEKLPDIDSSVEFPALAYSSNKDAMEHLCEEFGECKKESSEEWLEFFPTKSLIKSGFMRDFVRIYADGKPMYILIRNFSVKGEKRKSLQEVTGGLRTSASYTHTLQEILNIITITKGTMPVGSFKYNVHKYPGDIDIFERYNACCSVDEAKKSAAAEIQQILIRVKAAPDTYLGDFKAGEDLRYSINIGKWENVDGQETLVGYDKKKVESNIRNLRKQKLITQEELDHLLSMILDVNDLTHEKWDELQDQIKTHEVLRWNTQEITQGFKLLPGAEKISLEDAIAQRTLVKIDLWSRINSKYMEVTNFFMITATDFAGGKIETLTKELPDYEISIAKDVRFYSSAEHRKTLKALKRLWSLALFREDLELASRISPLFASNASALHQMNGEAEVLAMMIVKLPDPPLTQMMEQIDGFKPRIDQLSSKLEENEVLYEIIDKIIKPFYEKPVTSFTEFEEVSELLEEFQKKLGQMVEDMIFSEAQAAGLEDPASFL